MTEEPNNNNNAPSDEKKSSKTSYLQLSSLGLNYIERQQKYLWIQLIMAFNYYNLTNFQYYFSIQFAE